jgi:hypothetical protein
MSTAKPRHVKRRANSISDAVQLSLDFALRKHNRGTKRIAELMGVKIDTLYKWFSRDGMPINMLGAFENACGTMYVTEYLCAQAHLLAVEMPTGRKLTQTTVLELQKSFTDTTGLLIGFHSTGQDGAETALALTGLMGEIGWHRANVERCTQPDLPLFGADE